MEAEAQPTEAGSNQLQMAVLAVEGMHCASCAALIEETLVEDLGVSRAEVDLGTARAVVVYDASRHTTDDLCNAVLAAGYSATVVDVVT